MLSKQLLASLSLFVIFGAIHAAKDDKHCTYPAGAKRFKRDKFTGRFYSKAFEDESLMNLDCLQYFFSPPGDDGTCRVVMIYREKSDNSTHMDFKNIMIGETGHGKNINKDPLTIIGTDYKTYLVGYACDESTNTRYVSYLSGEQLPEYMDIMPAENLLDKHDINLFGLPFMNQADCPTDWSDAEKNEVDFTYNDVKEDLIAYGIVKAKE